MSVKNTYNLLKQLRDELNRLELADTEGKEKIMQLIQSIDSSIDQQSVSPDEYPGMLEKLKEFEVEFELSHPRLYSIINTLIQDLNAMGI